MAEYENEEDVGQEQYAPAADPWAEFNPQPISQQAAAPADDPWAEFNPQPIQQEPAEGGLATGIRHFVHALPAAATGLGVGALVGGIPGALIGGGAALAESYAQSKATESLWPEEAQRLQAGAEAHPVAATVGGVASIAPFVGVGGLTREALKASLRQRAVGAAVTGGADIGQQLAFTGTVDPTQAAIQAAGGAVFGGEPTALGRKIMRVPPASVTIDPAVVTAVRQSEPEQLPLEQGVTRTPQQMDLSYLREPINRPVPEPMLFDQWPINAGRGEQPPLPFPGERQVPGFYRGEMDETASTQKHGPAGPDAAAGTSQTATPAADISVTGERAINAEVGDQRAPDGTRDRTAAKQYSKRVAGQREVIAQPPQGGISDPALDAAIRESLQKEMVQPAPLTAPGERQAAAPRPPTEAPGARTSAATAAPGEPPARAAAPPPDVRAQVQSAIRDIQSETGHGWPAIGDVIKRSGLPRDVVHQQLTDMARTGEVTLHPTTVAEARYSPAEKESWIRHPDVEQPLAFVGMKAPEPRPVSPEMEGIPDFLKVANRPGLRVQRTDTGYALMRGNEALSEHGNYNEALKALNEARRAAGQPTAAPMARRSMPGETGRPMQVQGGILRAAEEKLAPGVGKAAPPDWFQRATAARQAAAARPQLQPPPQAGGGAGKAPPPKGPPPAGTAAAGAMQLPPAAPIQNLQPATPYDLKEGVLSSLRRMFNPNHSPSAQIAANALREAGGLIHRIKEAAFARFPNELHRVANKMDAAAYVKFVDAYESHKVATLPAEQQPIARALQQGYDDFWKSVTQLPKHVQAEAVKGYLTHTYDNSNGQVDNFVNKWYGGSGGSMKQRTHPTYADARKAGLTQFTNNPIENFVRYAEGMSHYISSRQTLQTLKDAGFIGYFSPKIVGATGSVSPEVRGSPPAGYAKIEMPWASQEFKDAYAPRDIADTLNNFYSGGLRAGQQKDFVNFLQATKNIWTGLELGMSFYHPFTMGHESFASGLARAIFQTAGKDYAGAAKSILTAPGEPVMAAITGDRALKLFRKQIVGTPEEERIMASYGRANIKPGDLVSTGEYSMTGNPFATDYWTAYARGALSKELSAEWDNISKTFTGKGGDWKTAATFLPRQVARIMQTLAAPIFQGYIPRLKMGVMMKDAQAFLKAFPNATDAELDAATKKFADSADNRLGEMNRDNLFMNKTAKETGMLMMRSFSWTIGAQREITGGAASFIRGIMKGENRLDPRSKAFDPKATYSLAFPMSVALMSAAWQYMRTGEGPKDWRDLVVPRTGGTTKYGPERELLPGFQKDFLGYAYHPQEELKNKLAAPWMTALEQVMNEGWKNGKKGPIVKKKDTWAQAVQERAAHVGRKLIPIGVQSATSKPKPGTALTAIERGIGFRVPGSYILRPAKLGWQ